MKRKQRAAISKGHTVLDRDRLCQHSRGDDAAMPYPEDAFSTKLPSGVLGPAPPQTAPNLQLGDHVRNSEQQFLRPAQAEGVLRLFLIFPTDRNPRV